LSKYQRTDVETETATMVVSAEDVAYLAAQAITAAWDALNVASDEGDIETYNEAAVAISQDARQLVDALEAMGYGP